jgi:hypothetical protein
MLGRAWNPSRNFALTPSHSLSKLQASANEARNELHVSSSVSTSQESLPCNQIGSRQRFEYQHIMKPKDIFKLAVRVLGLAFLYHGLSALPTVIPLMLTSTVGNFVIGVLMVVWPLAVAWWLIGGAPLLTCRAYPEATQDGGEAAASSGGTPAA